MAQQLETAGPYSSVNPGVVMLGMFALTRRLPQHLQQLNQASRRRAFFFSDVYGGATPAPSQSMASVEVMPVYATSFSS